MREVVESLANRVLEQVAATQRLVVALERYTEIIDRTRRELSEGNAALDAHRHEVRHALTQVNERLAVLSKDVDDSTKFQVQTALKTPIKENGQVVGLVNALGRLPTTTLVLILIFFLLAVASGWVKSWL